jgi:hypothetical protein
MKQRIRDLLHVTPFQPFTIHMADGKTCTVNHPDFVLAAPDLPNIHIEEPDGTLHTLSALSVTSVEAAGPSAVV